MLSGIGVMWPLLMVASSAFQAGASILKVIENVSDVRHTILVFT